MHADSVVCGYRVKDICFFGCYELVVSVLFGKIRETFRTIESERPGFVGARLPHLSARTVVVLSPPCLRLEPLLHKDIARVWVPVEEAVDEDLVAERGRNIVHETLAIHAHAIQLVQICDLDPLDEVHCRG